MSDVTCECLRCEAKFTGPVPRVFCPPCRPLAAAEMAEMQAEALTKFYLEHPGFPMPGDTVRLKTDEDRAFERDIAADLAELPVLACCPDCDGRFLHIWAPPS